MLKWETKTVYTIDNTIPELFISLRARQYFMKAAESRLVDSMAEFYSGKGWLSAKQVGVLLGMAFKHGLLKVEVELVMPVDGNLEKVDG